MDSPISSTKPPISHQWNSTLYRLDSAPRRIYVAAPMTEQGTAARLTLQLIDAGFYVTSRWLRKDFSDRPSKDDFRKYAGYEAMWGLADMEDVAAADTLVVLAEQPSTHGGFHFELGYFLGLGKTNVVVVGNRPNVFFFTQHVRWTPIVAGLVEWLKNTGHGRVDVDEIKSGMTKEELF